MARSHDGDSGGALSEDLLRRLRVSLIRRATLRFDGREEDVMLIDLGLRGVFVERGTGLPVDTAVAVSFRLPGNERPIAAHGRVAWRQGGDGPLLSTRLPAGVGVEFTDISETDAARVRAFLVERYRSEPRARQFTRAWPEDDE